MQTRKKWQKFLVIGVLLLTVYNILPTVFFYSKPLSAPVDATRGAEVASSIAQRVNQLEAESKSWLYSFCKLLKIKPQSIYFNPESPQQFTLTFKDSHDAKKFRTFLPRAGTLIPFVPMQLSMGAAQDDQVASKTIVVQRKIPIHFSGSDIEKTFQFSEKFEDGKPTPLYRALVFDRALQLGLSLGGSNENGSLAKNLSRAPLDEEGQTTLLRLCYDILAIAEVFGDNSSIAERYFATFSQVETNNRSQLIQGFIRTIEQAKDQAKLERINIQSTQQSLQAQGDFLDMEKQQRLEQLQAREKTFASAEALVKKRSAAFAAGKSPSSFAEISQQLEVSAVNAEKSGSNRQVLNLEGQNPFIQSLIIDWSTETIDLTLYEDILDREALFEKLGRRTQKEQADQFIYNEIAFAARQSGEKISPVGSGFQVTLNQLPGSTSFLALRLKEIAAARANELETLIKDNWIAKSPDLIRENFPIWNYDTYRNLPKEQQGLGLVVYAPALEDQMPQEGLKMNSVYVIAKGLDKVFQRINPSSDTPETQQFFKDFEALRVLLQQSGLFGYPGATLKGSPEFASDFIFEGEDYFQNLIKATREDFTVHGTKRFGVLEFSNVEQRILTENRIDDQIHEDLLKWRDDYYAAQLKLGGATPYDVPKPTDSPFLSNLHLSFVKYFRGDDRKILHWGLDLSGGKTVQIELFDNNGRLVTNDDDIKQGINELYSRVNKMGVSEVSIRREGNFITLDFPGSQSLSASDLIKASTMYFHIVNEKFSRNNSELSSATNQFLQEIWNEAAVTGRKSAEEINQIAWKHLHGDSLDPDVVQPRSQSAKTLYESGLRLRNPQDQGSSNLFNDAISQIAVLRGNDFTEWNGQTNPLVIIFRNYALEGANLKNIQGGYDSSKGNYLLFEIKGKETLSSGEKINPREDLYAWTSQFSKDKIAGTPYAAVSKGEGWRMAVILNGTIITSPTLSFPIRDGGTIEGSFTQREITKLESDLKAGSLTFTPRILSEKNVSPELGSKDRTLGIIAMSAALCLVILTMISYYRFAGLVASVAVVFNLLIMWATLQNIGATLTFASIAGVILALGMAVDANVLVFERIREELAATGRIATAVRTGYRKAFWAIFDSNITTIIAAIVLLQFDSGPIRGFAITLIIGIVSSMFTALFMTRFFFTGWIQNPKHVSLKMATLIKSAKFNFMKASKYAFMFSAVVILAGAFFFAKQHSSILGMDFTGGYSLNIELVQTGADLRQEVENALEKGGATKQEFQVRQLTSGNQMRIFLGKSMQLANHPFSGMPLENDLDSYSYPYELNPRISWVVNSLESGGLKLTTDSLETLQEQWSEISGQLSDSMQRSALIGLGIALLAILAYITFRFEFKYAISATLCLAHDIAATIGSIALLYALDVPIQIDLNTVAALMTIVGYSLNDTIIIFDRIREDLRLMRKASFKEIINHALNMTLSRTVMTSGTTLVALVPLALLGGGAVFGFALVMIIGVVFGTLSSLYIAAPLLNYFHERHKAKTVPQVAV